MRANLKYLLDLIPLRSISNLINTHLFKVVFVKTHNILYQFYPNQAIKYSDLKVLKEKMLVKSFSLNPNTQVKSLNLKLKAIFHHLTHLTIISFLNKLTHLTK